MCFEKKYEEIFKISVKLRIFVSKSYLKHIKE